MLKKLGGSQWVSNYPAPNTDSNLQQTLKQQKQIKSESNSQSVQPRTAPLRVVERYVYFIQAERNGLIKIGYSRHPQSRIIQIEADHHTGPLKMLGYFEVSSRSEESKLHEQFSEQHAVQEWFHSSPELLSFIEERCLPESRPKTMAQIIALLNAGAARLAGQDTSALNFPEGAA